MRAYTKREAELLNSEKYAEIRYYFAVACAASRRHDATLAIALETYGAHGPAISGCGRDHFPESVKNDLRALASKVTRFTYAGYEISAPRIRRSTRAQIARLVARRDGSGFYGPHA